MKTGRLDLTRSIASKASINDECTNISNGFYSSKNSFSTRKQLEMFDAY